MDNLCKKPGNSRKESATVSVADKLVDFTPSLIIKKTDDATVTTFLLVMFPKFQENILCRTPLGSYFCYLTLQNWHELHKIRRFVLTSLFLLMVTF